MKDMLVAPQRKTLRPHQVKALKMVRDSAAAGNRKIVCQLATGAGKTVLASRFIEGALEKGKRVMFTAPAVSLIDQSVSAFENEGITDIGVLQASHPRTNPDARVQVASVQTLARRDMPPVDLVIVDEAHIRAKVVEDLMQQRDDIFFIGLSATPWAKGMGLLWDDLICACTVSELIQQGFLSKFQVFAPDIPDLDGVKTVAGDYDNKQAEGVMSGKSIMGSIVENWLRNGENRPTLVFGVNRAHAASIAEDFQRAGVATAYIDAFTDVVERQQIERKFRSGEIKVACSVRTLTTGVDWPVSCIVDAAPTQSEILHLQKIGRGLRVNPGTEDLKVFDHAGNSLRLGLVTDIHHEELDKTPPKQRQKAEKKEKLPKACGNCGTLITGLVCPFCGHERKPIPGVETEDGELIEITEGERKVPTKQEKQDFYSMALWLAMKRGYKHGWAANLYRKKFGVWPRSLEEVMKPGDQSFLNYEKSCRIAWAKKNSKRRGN